MRYIIFLIVIVLGLTVYGYSDPFGMTTRTEIRSGADIAVAEYEYKARSDEAYYGASAIKTQARQETYRSLAWVGVAPILVLMVVAGAALLVALAQFGKIANTQAQTKKMLPEWDDWRG